MGGVGSCLCLCIAFRVSEARKPLKIETAIEPRNVLVSGTDSGTGGFAVLSSRSGLSGAVSSGVLVEGK